VLAQIIDMSHGGVRLAFDRQADIPAVFDGVNPSRNTAVPLKLKSVEQRANDTLWIRYAVVRS